MSFIILANAGTLPATVCATATAASLPDTIIIPVKASLKVILSPNLKPKEEGSVFTASGVITNGSSNLLLSKAKMAVIIFVVLAGCIILSSSLPYNTPLSSASIKQADTALVSGLGKVFAKAILQINKHKLKIIAIFFKYIKINASLFI